MVRRLTLIPHVDSFPSSPDDLEQISLEVPSADAQLSI